MDNPQHRGRPGATPLYIVIALSCLAPACSVDLAPSAAPADTLPRSVSDEIVIDAPVQGLASGRQDNAAAAFNGSHHLVVWADDRAGDFRVYGARVLPDGTVLDPVGIPIAAGGTAPAVASDGDGFLVVYEVDLSTPDAPFYTYPPAEPPWSGLRAARVSAAGAVLGPPIDVTTERARAPKVTFDGAGYVVVWEQSGDVFRTEVTPEGDVQQAGGTFTSSGEDPAISFDGAESLLVFRSQWHLFGMRVSPGGDLLDTTAFPVSPADRGVSSHAVGCWNGLCTVAWNEEAAAGRAFVAARIASDGTVLDANPLLLSQDTYTDDASRIFSVAGDAAGAVVVWDHPIQGESPVRQLRTARIDTQGQVSTEILLTDHGGRGAVSSDGAGALVAYTDGLTEHQPVRIEGAIAGIRLRDDGTPLDTIGFPISLGANGEHEPAVAFDGERFVVSWSDDRSAFAGEHYNIFAARVTPQGEALGAGAVATGQPHQRIPKACALGEGALISWWSQDMEDNCSLEAARLAPDGTASDPSPIEIGPELHCRGAFPATHAVSCSGGTALIAWQCKSAGTCVSFVSETGAPGPVIELDTQSATWHAASFDGPTNLLVWAHMSDGDVIDLRGARVIPPNALLDDPAGFPIAPLSTHARGLAVAFDGKNHVVLWLDASPDAPGLRAVRVTSDGVVLDPDPLLVAALPAACDALTLGPNGAANDGAGLVVAFRGCGPDGSAVLGVVLDRDLVAGPVFPISADAAPDGLPALASAGEGVSLVTYSSFRVAAPLGARRLMARLLTR